VHTARPVDERRGRVQLVFQLLWVVELSPAELPAHMVAVPAIAFTTSSHRLGL
jgi:hypothetical protein